MFYFFVGSFPYWCQTPNMTIWACQWQKQVLIVDCKILKLSFKAGVWPSFRPHLLNFSCLSFSTFRSPASVWLTRSRWWSATRCYRRLPSSCRGRCCRCFRTRRIWTSCWRKIATLARRGLLCRVALTASWRPVHIWWGSRGGQGWISWVTGITILLFFLQC